jgi:hypothetical protein
LPKCIVSSCLLFRALDVCICSANRGIVCSAKYFDLHCVRVAGRRQLNWAAEEGREHIPVRSRGARVESLQHEMDIFEAREFLRKVEHMREPFAVKRSEAKGGQQAMRYRPRRNSWDLRKCSD